MNTAITRFLLIAIATAMLLTACQSEEKEAIRAVAQGYLDGVANYDFDRAAPYASNATIEQTFPLMREMTRISDQEYIKSNTPATVTIKKIKLLNDTAATVYYHKSTPIRETDDKLRVVKHDTVWQAEVLIERTPMDRMIVNGIKKSHDSI